MRSRVLWVKSVYDRLRSSPPYGASQHSGSQSLAHGRYHKLLLLSSLFFFCDNDSQSDKRVREGNTEFPTTIVIIYLPDTNSWLLPHP
jgi:hypothetical protein